MAKRRNLRSIPHNITKSFFGTLRYSGSGYMADWLKNAAAELAIHKGRIDVFKGRVYPEELNLPVFQPHIADLKAIIYSELERNGFPPDFIVEATIDLEFRHSEAQTRSIYCFPSIVDRDGRRDAPGRFIEYASEKRFSTKGIRNRKWPGFLSTLWRFFRG